MELEIDHEHASEATKTWSPFAKALQGAEMSVLDEVPLEAAYRLREERRLESMRNSFNRVWRACKDEDAYAAVNASNLAAELDERIEEAREEWRAIDAELLKWVGGTGAVALLGAGSVGFYLAALGAAISGATALGLANWKRKSFVRRFPAGFFLKLET